MLSIGKQLSVFWIIQVYVVKMQMIAALPQGFINILLLLGCQTDGALRSYYIMPQASGQGKQGRKGRQEAR
uniref:Uncharacterized protein n=1 Tax=Piliocolobus tephrosceles TaxID=591936 RepID=A0A8C9IMW4_9PRIM